MAESIAGTTRRTFLECAALCLLASVACDAQPVPQRPASNRLVGGPCEGCEAIHLGMPDRLTWETAIAPASEPGERLEMSGVVYRPDGRTPAPGVILYFHQTDATGLYPPAAVATGYARRHGRLRSWLRTNERGEYRFTTIRPGSYPNSSIPAHIHLTVKEPELNEYYVDDFEFDDDPLLTAQERGRREKRGGSGIVRLTRTGGVWRGRRDIILGRNVTGYD